MEDNVALLITIIAAGIIAVIMIVRNQRTKNAPPRSKTIQTSLTRDQIVEIAERHFPKSIIISAFSWKYSWPSNDEFVAVGRSVKDSVGCLILLLTGIIFGIVLLLLFNPQSESVRIDFSRFESSGELTITAKGLRAQKEAEKLGEKIVQQIFPKS
jgi:hypothetical protein